ncbi:MAG: 50S ribosomal protein L21 [Patescibacteria group bacterium]|jgi:large subunit ribosomal protein L21
MAIKKDEISNGVKIAVIKTGGKQYKVSQGQNLKIEKIDAEVGAVLKFPALLIAEEENINLGKPLLGEIVEGKILEQGKGKKVSVVKFKNKTRYKRNVGHRQPYTKVEITKIA